MNANDNVDVDRKDWLKFRLKKLVWKILSLKFLTWIALTVYLITAGVEWWDNVSYWVFTFSVMSLGTFGSVINKKLEG